MPTSHRRPANKHSKRKTHRRKAQRRILHGLLLVFAALMLCFGLFLWKAALELNAPAEPAVSSAEDDFRPVVSDPPYRVAIDAGHGGNDPGARGVVEEKQITAAPAAARYGCRRMRTFSGNSNRPPRRRTAASSRSHSTRSDRSFSICSSGTSR